MNHIADRIKTARKEAGLTQAQLAEKAGISRSYIGGIELGSYNPSVNTLIRISKATGKSPNFLCDMTEIHGNIGKR